MPSIIQESNQLLFSTTDAIPVVILLKELDADSVIKVVGQILAKDVNGVCLSRKTERSWKRIGTGNIAAVGSVVPSPILENDTGAATYTVVWTNSGALLQFTVTGAVGVSIDWVVKWDLFGMRA